MTDLRVFRRVLICALLAAAPVVAACKTTAPEVPGPAAVVDLTASAKAVADDLSHQLSAAAKSRKLVFDPMLDRSTAQQTSASVKAQAEVATAMGAAMPKTTIVPIDAKAMDASALVVSGTLAATEPPDGYLLNVAITDRQNGLVIAQSASRFHQAGLDSTPTRFYTDSPSLVRDRSVEGYVKTSETTAGNLADPLYVAQLPTEALLAAALAAYNNGQWDDALTGYTAAAARPEGQTLRTFNGMYLCDIHLGKTMAAEEAFGKIAALGLATNNLAVKLLFRPGSTEFVADPVLSGEYPMWIRQIGLATRASGSCLHVVGHTSHSGTEAVNDRLSLARAEAVRTLLEKQVPGLAKQTTVAGDGFRKNIVGTGTDDARDALDRRVEFEVDQCTG